MLDSSCGSMFWMPSVLQQAEAANPNFRCACVRAAADTQLCACVV
jgi:hypothetical protein